MSTRKKVKAHWTELEWFQETLGTSTVWLLPLTAEAYDAMVRQIADELFKSMAWLEMERLRSVAIASLRAIGISRPKDSTITRPKERKEAK